VVHDDDLGLEGSGLLGGIVLGVTADVSTADILDGNVLDAVKREQGQLSGEATTTTKRDSLESDVVSGKTSLELLVVHLDRLDLSGDVGGGEDDDHTGLDGSGLDTTDGHCADSSDLVDILESEEERV
jgi:hypothetical protein